MIDRLKRALHDSQAVIVGAGAGLSTSAGFTYDGERFQKYFADFGAIYGFEDMYSGGFYPYETPEEFWGFWCRNIFYNRYDLPPSEVHRKLLELVRDKNYFVLTTNVDHLFQLNGFDKTRLFYTQGDYGLFQCSTPCHDKTYVRLRFFCNRTCLCQKDFGQAEPADSNCHGRIFLLRNRNASLCTLIKNTKTSFFPPLFKLILFSFWMCLFLLFILFCQIYRYKR